MLKYSKIFSSLFITSALLSPLRAQVPLGGETSTNEIIEINVEASEGAPEAVAKRAGSSHKHKEHKRHHGNRLEPMNVAGSVKSFLMNVDGLEVTLDVTFEEGKLPGFPNTPENTLEYTPLSAIEKFVMHNIDDYRVELGFSGKLFDLSLKPTRIQKTDKDSVRITFIFSSEKSASDLQGLHYFEHKLRKNNPKDLPFVRFVDYGASGKVKIPLKDKKTFSLFVRQGATLSKTEKHGKIEHSVVFKGVERVFSKSAAGQRERLEPNEFVKMIGHGKHPFKPNGNFFVLKDGKPRQCSMIFDKATYEGNDLTFTVSSLNNGKPSKADATACFDGKSTAYDLPIIVFVDGNTGSTEK